MRKNHLAKTNAKTKKKHHHLQSINFELFLVVKNHCVFSAHILKLCVFFPEMCMKNAKRRPKINTGLTDFQPMPTYSNMNCITAELR